MRRFGQQPKTPLVADGRPVALLEAGLAFSRLQLAVFRAMYLYQPDRTINLPAPPASTAIEARNQWLRDHAQSMAIAVPSVLRTAESMEGRQQDPPTPGSPRPARRVKEADTTRPHEARHG